MLQEQFCNIVAVQKCQKFLFEIYFSLWFTPP